MVRRHHFMVSKQVLEETLGECIGLERAAQKAVQELDAKGLLPEEMKKKLMDMHSEANQHEGKLRNILGSVTQSDGIDSDSVEKHAQETVEKTSEMMKTYLGDQPDELDALEFLSIAEGGEVIHYEILSKLATQFKDKKLAKDASSILQEEKKHLRMCIQLAKTASIKE